MFIVSYSIYNISQNNDYYPFGSLVPNRHGSSTAYRYGFNGKEKDDELKGEGNSIAFESRLDDPRIGRFITLDPRMNEFASMSPYCYAANNPIKFVDVLGEGPGDGTKNLVIPSSPGKVDTKIWSPLKANEGIERGHTQRWLNKETGTTLAFDKGKEGAAGWEGKDHFHVLNEKGQRLQANGELAGGVIEGKAYYKKGATNSHFTPGEATEIKIKIPSAGAVIEGIAKGAKVVNRVLIPVAIAASVYDVATAKNKPREAVKQASGWAGAWAGGEAGAGVGASIGGGVGAFFAGVGAVPGAAVGGFIGGLAGGIGGFFAGSSIGEDAYDAATKK